jgi:hypothetical protein
MKPRPADLVRLLRDVRWHLYQEHLSIGEPETPQVKGIATLMDRCALALKRLGHEAPSPGPGPAPAPAPDGPRGPRRARRGTLLPRQAAEERQYMNPYQASDLIGVSYEWLQARRRDGTGPEFIKIGHRVLYDRQSIVHWLDGKRRGRAVITRPEPLATLIDKPGAEPVPIFSGKLTDAEKRILRLKKAGKLK